ncbi:MAG: TauD/TfdA family dioxygenase [Chromatiales bacterium]|jgi:alpha-ketoglutarate-dependent taurine dioxygenase|nr:TauD/TfdA family dioxygenase [Chromatiales bacterium]
MNSVEITEGFGALINDVDPADLSNPDFRNDALALWRASGGLLAVRGAKLTDIGPELLVTWSETFGAVEQAGQTARERSMVTGFPIMRIGNIRDESGELKASLARVPELTSDEDVRYNPKTRRPVWHTDSTFREHPPIGSVFHCKQAPAKGGETLFADTRRAFEALPSETQSKLRSLEAVCSLAHHDKKINSYSPDYPVLSPEQRAANPPRRVPIVLEHPETGVPALYGLNSSTCAVVPKGQLVESERMDEFDLQGVEDESVLTLRDLLPHITGPKFTVKWQWCPGDIVVWDNRCTMHSGTGYDYDQYTREMWRLTLLAA